MSSRPNRGALAWCVLVLAVATGCGSTTGTADEPSSASTNRTLRVGDTVEVGQALIVSASNVDGPTTRLASALVDERTIDSFVDDIDARLAAEVRTAVKAVEVPDGSTLFGSVVAVGCERPVAVSLTKTFDGIEATAELPKSGVQCLVPVTSVALFLVADAG